MKGIRFYDVVFPSLEDTRVFCFRFYRIRSLPPDTPECRHAETTDRDNKSGRMEEQKEYEKLMNFCETVNSSSEKKNSRRFVSESLAEKGIDAASLHRWGHAR